MAAISYPSVIPSLVVANRVFTDLDNLIILKGYAEGTTNVRGTARKQNASAGYQVPTGKKFVIKAARIQVNNIASNANFVALLAYSDNDVGAGSSTAFTNAVYVGGSTNIAAFGAMTALSNSVQEFPFNFEVPAGKYIGVWALASATNYIGVEIFGYEVAV